VTDLVGPPVPEARRPRWRRRRWFALAGVVLIAAGVVTFLVLRPAPRPTDGHSLAEVVVATMAQPPGDELRGYQCTPGPSDPPRSDPVYDAGSYVLDSEDQLSADLDFARVTDPANRNVRYALYLVDYQGGWCLGGLAMCSRTESGGYLVTIPFICHQAYPEIPAY
jgi:hypothetical protein